MAENIFEQVSEQLQKAIDTDNLLISKDNLFILAPIFLDQFPNCTPAALITHFSDTDNPLVVAARVANKAVAQLPAILVATLYKTMQRYIMHSNLPRSPAAFPTNTLLSHKEMDECTPPLALPTDGRFILSYAYYFDDTLIPDMLMNLTTFTLLEVLPLTKYFFKEETDIEAFIRNLALLWWRMPYWKITGCHSVNFISDAVYYSVAKTLKLDPVYPTGNPPIAKPQVIDTCFFDLFPFVRTILLQADLSEYCHCNKFQLLQSIDWTPTTLSPHERKSPLPSIQGAKQLLDNALMAYKKRLLQLEPILFNQLLVDTTAQGADTDHILYLSQLQKMYSAVPDTELIHQLAGTPPEFGQLHLPPYPGSIREKIFKCAFTTLTLQLSHLATLFTIDPVILEQWWDTVNYQKSLHKNVITLEKSQFPCRSSTTERAQESWLLLTGGPPTT